MYLLVYGSGSGYLDDKKRWGIPNDQGISSQADRVEGRMLV
jgi:hypothetical protein